MKKIYFALIMIAFALIGCKAHVEVETKLSNLINQPVHTEHAIISIEIPTCNSYEDSRLPSRALTDVNKRYQQYSTVQNTRSVIQKVLKLTLHLRCQLV